MWDVFGIKELARLLDVRIGQVTSKLDMLLISQPRVETLLSEDHIALVASIVKLKEHSNQLQTAIKGAGGLVVLNPIKEKTMSSPVIQNLIDQVNKTTSVMDSAIALVNGINTRIQEAVDQAIANGATKEELEPLFNLKDEIQNKTDALAAAVEANTTPAP